MALMMFVNTGIVLKTNCRVDSARYIAQSRERMIASLGKHG
jgi:hypothetical protein